MKKTWHGKMYDSGLERDRRIHLEILERGGEISDLKDHPRIELEPDIFYHPDFEYMEKGRMVYEDTKGVEGDRFRLIKKIWRNHGPGPLRVVVRQYGKWKVKQEIFPR